MLKQMLTAERPAPQQNVKINSKLKLIAFVYLQLVSALAVKRLHKNLQEAQF